VTGTSAQSPITVPLKKETEVILTPDPPTEGKAKIRITCPACKAAYKVDERHTGKTVQCLACGRKMRVAEDLPMTEETTVPNKRSGWIRFHCPKCGAKLEVKDSRGGELIPCQHCYEQIRVPTRRYQRWILAAKVGFLLLVLFGTYTSVSYLKLYLQQKDTYKPNADTSPTRLETKAVFEVNDLPKMTLSDYADQKPRGGALIEVKCWQVTHPRGTSFYYTDDSIEANFRISGFNRADSRLAERFAELFDNRSSWKLTLMFRSTWEDNGQEDRRILQLMSWSED
jgi:predicted Zn finger-like uncharacterized protein